MAGSDVLIVGAGSAGCVLAARLSEDPGCQVTLLEAGGADAHPMLRMPSAFYMPVRHPRFNWGYATEPESNLGNRQLLCPRGRVLGGSSSINGMVYVRGHAEDFDRWEQLGARGWNYQEVLPYFKKAQKFAGEQLDERVQGDDGPLRVRDGEMANPLYGMFLKAAQQAGHNLRADLNDGVQEGFGPLPMTVGDGVRSSTAHAYLRPVAGRPNLRIVKHARVLRIGWSGQRAASVEARVRGRSQSFAADQIVLCAGAINTPQLLMLSGVGPAADLSRQDIAVRQDLPGVGGNLMDHLEIYVQQACTQPLSLAKDLSLLGRARIGWQWLTARDGLGATNHFEVGGFIRSAPNLSQPDIQFHFLPAAMQYDGSAKSQGHGFQAHVGPMLSASRGRVSLRSADPADAPVIRFNYMSDPTDWVVFRAAIRAAREIFAQPAFDAVRGEEIRPGVGNQEDAALDRFIREHAESAYHPCGTCRMGVDEQSVVDETGRVHGVENLRVVDASIFPHITNGNLNAPTIMLAERMADIIKAGGLVEGG